jgi:hypothetical protein
VSGPASRLAGSELPAAAERCLAAARALSALLGHDSRAAAALPGFRPGPGRSSAPIAPQEGAP